jgi:hypothetical protein
MKFYNLPILPQRIALLIEIGELKWTIEKRNMLFNNTKNGSHEPREQEQRTRDFGNEENRIWSLELRIDYCELVISNSES